jgi:hypothetical protein
VDKSTFVNLVVVIDAKQREKCFLQSGNKRNK